MDSATIGAVVWNYTYNGKEQLAIRTRVSPAATTHFIHDLFGNVIAETNGTAAGTTREYIWLPETEIAPADGARSQVDRPLAVVNGVNTASRALWYVSVDHLNRAPSRCGIPARPASGSRRGSPEGGGSRSPEPQRSTPVSPGRWFQSETGLHYNWHRQYDPTTGRYTQPDPLGFIDGPSVYGYVGGLPTQAVDFSGRSSSEIPEPTFPDDPNPSYSKQAFCIAMHAVVDLSCRMPFRTCKNYDNCDQLNKKILNFGNCIAARKAIQKVCYPADSGHNRIIESEEQGLKNCKELANEKRCYVCPAP